MSNNMDTVNFTVSEWSTTNFSNDSSALYFRAMNGTRSLPRATVYPMSYRVVGTVADVIIFIVGFLGNIMICAVVKNTKSLQTPTYCYLVSLAVADILLVCAAIPEAIISYHLYSKQWILGHAGCAIMVFITFLAINAGSLSILAFTIERYIAICHPMLAQKVCTVSRARNIILTTWAIVCLYSAPWLGLSGTRPLRLADVTGMEKCDYLLSRDMYIYFFLFDVVVFYCVPLLISVILYLRMGLVLHKSMQDLRKQIGTRMPLRGWSMRKSSSCTLENPPRNCASMSRGASTKNPPKWLSVPGDESRTGPSTQRDTQTANATMQSRCQVVKMLIVVVVCFAVLWLPYRGLLVYNSLVSKPWLNMWYVLFAKTLVYMNSAINPFLYTVLSRKFREATFRMLACCSFGRINTRTRMGPSRSELGLRQISTKSRDIDSVSLATSATL